jgi:chromosome segregation ATPase
MNRKLYDENHQHKERSIEQRQQIEHYHALLKENQQQQEKMRKEFDERLQQESDGKRRMQQSLEAKSQENFVIISNLKEKIDELKSKEANLSEKLNSCKLELHQERSNIEIYEKKANMLEKERHILKESSSNEKSELNAKISELEKELECNNSKHFNELNAIEERFSKERAELKDQLTGLENKLEEVIKEKANVSFKYGQVTETNRELSSIIKNNEAAHTKKIDELKYLFFS